MNFDEVKKLMDRSVENDHVPCSDIVITHEGKTVFRYMNGTRDDEKKLPVRGDELYFLYSASKPITCTAALQLYEKGKIRLEDRVADYIPEFGNMMVKTENGVRKAEKAITLKNLFTMTSGLNYDLASPGILGQIQEKPDSSTLEMVRSMTGDPLDFEPGEHYQYSLSHDVLAAVVEVVADMPFGDYLQKHIFDVCEMNRTGFVLNEEIRKNMCSQYTFDWEEQTAKLIEKENQYILTPAYQSGGAGLISCVDDYIKFATAMANDERLLKAETRDLMRADHLSGQAYLDFQNSKPGYSYGLGVRTDAAGNFAAKGEFGWDGAAGAYTLIDPDNRIAVFYATHIHCYGDYLYDRFHPAIRDAIYRGISG